MLPVVQCTVYTLHMLIHTHTVYCSINLSLHHFIFHLQINRLCNFPDHYMVWNYNCISHCKLPARWSFHRGCSPNAWCRRSLSFMWISLSDGVISQNKDVISRLLQTFMLECLLSPSMPINKNTMENHNTDFMTNGGNQCLIFDKLYSQNLLIFHFTFLAIHYLQKKLYYYYIPYIIMHEDCNITLNGMIMHYLFIRSKTPVE